MLIGIDAALAARGSITPVAIPDRVRNNAVIARVLLTGGDDVRIASLRLEPPLVRVDLWSPDCWREQTANRRRRRSELGAICDTVRESADGLPTIVGGDFNAPPGDAVFAVLKPELHDAFAEAGRGWGNTIINAASFFRIDQIWLSPHFRAVDVYARTTKHSDHRMVVCDVELCNGR